jgi:hypothetical protein
MPDNRLLFPLHLFNIWAKLPGSSNPSRFRLLPEVEHICVMGKITTVGGDGMWIRAEPVSKPLVQPENRAGKEKFG